MWHVVFSSQTSNVLFHWKLLFFCGGFGRHIVVGHHLGGNQHQVDAFESLSLFHVTWNLKMKKIDMFLSSQKLLHCRFTKKSHSVCWFQQQQCVFASFLLNSPPILCLLSIGLSDQAFASMQANKCNALLSLHFFNMLLHWKKKHVLRDCISSDSVLQSAPSWCLFSLSVTAHFLHQHKQWEVMHCFAPELPWHAFSLKNHVLCGHLSSDSVF